MSTFTETRAVKFYAMSCCQCSVRFAVLDEYDDERRKDGAFFHCPNGHSQSYADTEAKRLRKELDREQQRHNRALDRLRDERDRREQTERKLSATRGVVTRTKNRVGKGVCPCCNRSFANLRKHMHSKHPQYAETPKEKS